MTRYNIEFAFADNIKKYRKRNYWTQEQLAEKAGVSHQTINAIEIAQRFPSAKMLAKICNALGVSVVELFEGV